MQFNLKTAQEYATQGKLEDWIHIYLNTGYWQNIPFSDGLKRAQRWWIAPVKVPLNNLLRCCGPEENMPYRVSHENWENHVSHIKDTLTDIADLPPLIIEYQDGNYIISDGNHRHEAIRRKGWTHCHVIIWYNSLEEWQNSPYAGNESE